MNTHVVVKPLPLGGEVLEPGTEVDASDWRNREVLESQRYLKSLSEKKATRKKEDS
jgi:hypothetical protein